MTPKDLIAKVRDSTGFQRHEIVTRASAVAATRDHAVALQNALGSSSSYDFYESLIDFPLDAVTQYAVVCAAVGLSQKDRLGDDDLATLLRPVAGVL